MPPEADRSLLRVMRNAIDHIDQPIIDGRAGKGNPLQLEVENHASKIADAAGTHTVSHATFGGWMETLHRLAIDLIDRPQNWIRN